MSRIDVSWAAKVLGGRVERPDRIRVPGPNDKKRGRNDDSLMVFFGDDRPEGYEVYSHSGDDWRECRDYVRDRLGLPAWKPDGKPRAVFVADQFIYEQADGFPYHRIDLMSDGTYRHFWFEADGWDEKHPPMFIPFALPDLHSDETVWLVRGEDNARLIRDGFNQVATTYPSGVEAHADASFLYHLADKDVRILNVGGAESRRFCALFSEAMGLPVWSLPEGISTLRALARTEGGSLDQCLSGDEFEPVPPSVEGEDTPSPPRIIATPFQWVDAQDIPRRPKLYGDHLFRKFVSLLVSPGGIGKSSLALVECLAMASGRALLVDDKPKHPDHPLTVWYWNGEDPQEETQRRVVAAAKHHNLTPADIGPRLYTDTGREQTITLGQIARGEITLDEALFEALEAAIIERGIDVFTIDPFVSSHRMGENDNNAIDAIIKRLNKLADRCNCAVEIVHHVRKPSSGNKEQTDVNDARGASALLGGVRSARVLNVMSEEIADLARIDQKDRFSYFSVTNGKSNMTKRSGDAKWRHLADFDLCNGPVGESDHVGVVEYFEIPDALSHIPANAVEIALDVASKFDHGRLSSKSPDWFGYLVGPRLGIDAENKANKETLRILISKWIEAGVLKIRMGEDKNRVMREFLTIGDEYSAPLTTAKAHVPDDDPF